MKNKNYTIDVKVVHERQNEEPLTIEEATKVLNRQTAIKSVAKMISSGEIPHDIYIKYLSGTYLGFMTEDDIINILEN